ncbi:MAG: glycosyltransferase family 2 protein [Acidobacteriaceae bacterium]|nr:glycosyltransferase family 2 protein [Acidobacteriaceae bacterium]MBV9765449.1 glycosyltransferase family 2 protein [Acidobacteriaceae bacterium]
MLYRWLESLIIAYVALVNATYFVLMLVGYFALRKKSDAFSPKDIDVLLKSPFVPSVSVLAPAYNEAATIRDSVRSMLRLRHPRHEVIVINDGSADGTLDALIDEFRLYRSSRVALAEIPTAAVRGVYESRDPIPLVVIDKANGGKADALNCGINYARNDLLAAVDADSIIERDALLQISRPFLERPEDTMAVGGIIRVANDCVVEHGAVVAVKTPGNWLARFQIVEYLRAFLAGRTALSFANCLLVISGAFGMFRRKLVVEMGGYRVDTMGEDMELVIRIHRYCRERHIPCRVAFISDSVCWTEVPESRRVLQRQRIRWQRGCAECMIFHKRLIGNVRFGSVGLLGMPYFLICEIFGPFVELTGYLITAAGLTLQWIPLSSALLFFVVSVLFGLLLSVTSVLFEELTICKYPNPRDVARLLLAGLLENLGYRQVLLLWRVRALFQVLAKKQRSWGEMERRGFQRV